MRGLRTSWLARSDVVAREDACEDACLELETREVVVREVLPEQARAILLSYRVLTFTERRKGWLLPTYTFTVTAPSAVLALAIAEIEAAENQDRIDRLW